jgi:hypothetical protein
MVRVVRWTTVVIAGLLVGACSSSTASTSPPATQAATANIPPVTAPLPTAAPTGPLALPIIHDTSARAIAAGTYVTADSGGLAMLPGLTLSIPAGWTTTEADVGEISLHPVNLDDESVLIWEDVAAVVTNDRAGTVGTPLPGVGTKAADLIAWLTTTKDFEIFEKPAATTIGAGINGTQLALTTSKTANFGSSDCPSNPRCSAIFTDPAHWGSNFFAIGGDEVARIFIAQITDSHGQHTFLVTLDAPDTATLAKLATAAQPILDSLVLPAGTTAP